MKMTAIYLIDPKDCVFDKNGNLVRMKRKYGDRKRVVHKMDLTDESK